MTTNDIILLSLLEVAPPGREPQVRALKKKPGIGNPYAVAWASYNDEEGGPGSGRYPRGSGKARVSSGRSNAQGALRRAMAGPKTKANLQRISDYKAQINYLNKHLAKQANSSGGLPQDLRDTTQCGFTQSDKSIFKALLSESVEGTTYRFQESMRCSEVLTTAPGSTVDAPAGPMAMCVLITEGLGNMADMHYYGKECLKSAPALFEGKPCFIDHQAKSEQEDRPERTVRDKCGYFKNVRVEEVDGRLGLVGELHFDLTETGSYAFKKAATAVHYKGDFPDGEEYVGLSIAADGDLEERTMVIDGVSQDVKYVTRFTAVGSVDEVTSPARGGRFIKVY